jgi:hypothetical protein
MESPSALLEIPSLNTLDSPSFNLGVFDLPHEEDFSGAEFLTEEVTEFTGVDIMQGFQKIGSGTQSSRNTPKGPRAPLGRSFTSMF